MNTLKAPFSLTPTEQAIFARLLAVKTSKPVTLRAAGGWVRDKLLGKESHDIDIAIDGMTGQQFCKEAGLMAAIIEAKPEQSKHLETATARVEGEFVDFCNLRDENFGGAYDESRILTENRFATPEVDAQRRDFTVGALFYNLSTGEVEDFVGGLYDLGFKLCGDEWSLQPMTNVVLRTPLPPKQTLMDDPLRKLRGFRFLAKLEGAKFEDDILEAMQLPEVKAEFVKRITPERIASELVGKREDETGYKPGIVGLPHATTALREMFKVGLLDIILDVPAMAGFKPFDMDQRTRWHLWNVFEHTMKVMEALREHPYFQSLPVDRQNLLMFACLMHDLGKRDPNCCQQKDNGDCGYNGHDQSSANAARAVCNKLKLSNDDTAYVVAVVGGHMRPHATGWGTDRVLRRFRHDLPDCWQDVIVHSLADMIGGGTASPMAEKIAEYERLLARGRELIEVDKNAKDSRKPIINGAVVMAVLPELNVKSGYIKTINAMLLEVRLNSPETTEEQYLDLIREVARQFAMLREGCAEPSQEQYLAVLEQIKNSVVARYVVPAPEPAVM